MQKWKDLSAEDVPLMAAAVALLRGKLAEAWSSVLYGMVQETSANKPSRKWFEISILSGFRQLRFSGTAGESRRATTKQAFLWVTPPEGRSSKHRGDSSVMASCMTWTLASWTFLVAQRYARTLRQVGKKRKPRKPGMSSGELHAIVHRDFRSEFDA